MVGDWIFAFILLLAFIVLIVLGTIILNSAEGITPSLRKTDSNLKDAYDQYRTAGMISLWTGIVGTVLVVLAMILLLITPVMKAGDVMPRWLKVLLKSLFGIAVIVLVFLCSYYLYQAIASIQASRTYHLSRLGARAAFDNSIASTNLAATIYIVIGVILILLFIGLAIYDLLAKGSPKPKVEVLQVGAPTNLTPQPGGVQVTQQPFMIQSGVTQQSFIPQPGTLQQASMAQPVSQAPVVQLQINPANSFIR